MSCVDSWIHLCILGIGKGCLFRYSFSVFVVMAVDFHWGFCLGNHPVVFL